MHCVCEWTVAACCCCCLGEIQFAPVDKIRPGSDCQRRDARWEGCKTLPPVDATQELSVCPSYRVVCAVPSLPLPLCFASMLRCSAPLFELQGHRESALLWANRTPRQSKGRGRKDQKGGKRREGTCAASALCWCAQFHPAAHLTPRTALLRTFRTAPQQHSVRRHLYILPTHNDGQERQQTRCGCRTAACTCCLCRCSRPCIQEGDAAGEG